MEKKFLIVIAIFLIFFGEIKEIVGQTASDFLCSDEYCDEYDTGCEDLECKTNYHQSHFLNPAPCNCCNYCFDYMNETESCETTYRTRPDKMCGPNLECSTAIEPRDPTCQLRRNVDVNSCQYIKNQYYEDKVKGDLGVAQFLPACDARGEFLPKQCQPGGSTCFCVNKKGERIFGEGLYTEFMNCDCSKDIDMLKSMGMQGRWPHCLPNGNYDELQCTLNNCTCRSDPQIKFLIQNLLDEKLLKDNTTIPCYNPEIHPTTPVPYLRECEQIFSYMDSNVTIAASNNITMKIINFPNCGPDGNYDKVQTIGEKIICADSKGDRIGNYEARTYTPDADAINCYCARDESLHASAGNKYKCNRCGNYRPWQCSGNICYCVDKLGIQQVNVNPREVSIENVATLPCYYDPNTITGEPCR